MKLTGNEQAYPNVSYAGLTIRQAFAMAADVSFDSAWNLIAKAYPDIDKITAEMIVSTMVELKVMVANALIEELNKSEE